MVHHVHQSSRSCLIAGCTNFMGAFRLPNGTALLQACEEALQGARTRLSAAAVSWAVSSIEPSPSGPWMIRPWKWACRSM
jgi:hypothetical protein